MRQREGNGRWLHRLRKGIAYEPDLPAQPNTKVRVWVRTWSEIIEEAKRRWSHFRDDLDHDPSLEHALDDLVRQNADVVPVDLVAKVSTPDSTPVA